MKKLLLFTAVVAVSCTSTFAATNTYFLDIQPSGQPIADSFQEITYGASLTNSGNVGSFALGNGLSISFSGVFRSFGFNNASNPLTTDGWLIDSNINGGAEVDGVTPSDTATFTLSGLTAGDTVTMYGTQGWDGDGRAAFISFGGSTFIDLAGGTDDTGTTVALSELQLIASDILVAGSESLDGIIQNQGRPEGQFGGFAFVVTSVPEPSSYALLAGLAALCVVVTKRNPSD